MLKEISIEIIRKCPNNCLHCSSSSSENSSEVLDYGLFTSVVRDALRLGARTICLSGGEPFLHENIIEMVKFIASLGLQAYIYTSGIIFDAQGRRTYITRDILREISKDVTKLIFNIEAALPQTYNMIMGTEDCFEIMKQSIRNAHELSITAEAHFVPMKLNVGEAEAVVALCKELNISKVSFLRLVLHGRAERNRAEIALTDHETEQFKNRLEELQEQSDIGIRVGVPFSRDTQCHKCEAANGKLNIRYDGKVFPCEVFKNERMNGSFHGWQPENIHNASLMDIYRDSLYLNYVRELEQEFSCSGHCETCIGQYLIGREGINNYAGK